MPISVQYAPPLDIIADAALYAGQGEFNQQSIQNNLRQQALAQQAAAQQQDTAARLYSQQQSIAAQQQSQAFDAFRRAQELEAGRQHEMAGLKQRNEWRGDELQQANQWDNERFDKQQQAVWQTQSVTASEQSLNNHLGQLASSRQRFASPEDVQEFERINALWKATKNNRAIASNPKAYGEAIGKVQAELERSGILDRLKPQLSAIDQFGEETVEIPGRGLFGRDRSGAWRQVAPEKDPLDEFVNKNLKAYVQDDGSVDTQSLLRDFQAVQQVKDALKQGIAGGPMPQIAAPPRKVTPKNAQNFDEYWGAIDDTDRLTWITKATDLLKTDKELGPPSTDAIMDKAKELVSAVRGFKSQEQSDPAQIAAWQEFARQSGFDIRPGGGVMPKQSAPFFPGSPSKARERVAPPAIGEEYIAPDGTRRRRMQ